MAKLICKFFPNGLEVNSSQTVMEFLMDNKVPIASSCGGEGICGKCLISVERGDHNLTKKTPLELKRNDLNGNKRLSCQCQCLGDISISTSYW